MHFCYDLLTSFLLDTFDMLEFESDKLGFGFEGAGFKRTSEKFVGYGRDKPIVIV